MLQSTDQSKQWGSGQCPVPILLLRNVLIPRLQSFSLRAPGGVPCWRQDTGLWVVILLDGVAAVFAHSPPQWKQSAYRRHSSCCFFSADQLHILGGNVWITADVTYGTVSGR